MISDNKMLLFISMEVKTMLNTKIDKHKEEKYNS